MRRRWPDLKIRAESVRQEAGLQGRRCRDPWARGLDCLVALKNE
jgi:hypothetical protein